MITTPGQSADGSGASRINQAGRDLYVGVEGRAFEPGLVSVAPPLGRLGHGVFGRDDLVAEVSDRVGGGVGVLHGAGGRGKTTVALCVSREVDAQVWWVDASTGTSLVEGLREVASRAGSAHEDVARAWSGQASAPDLLWRSLHALRRRWLLIVDNADDVQLLAAAGHRVGDGTGWVREPGPHGGVLVTTRDHDTHVWGRMAAHVAVPVLGVDDATCVLLDLAPAAGSAADARRLAERLGGLPLALTAIGRYLAVAGGGPDLPGLRLPRTFAAFLDSPEGVVPELLAASPGTAPSREMLHRTWDLSLDLLADRGLRSARAVLRLLSWFAREPVPHFLLDADVIAGFAAFEGITAATLAHVLRGLADLGLLDPTAIENPALFDVASGGPAIVSGVALHPVVRDVVRSQVRLDGEAELYTECCAALLDAAVTRMEGDDFHAMLHWHALFAHADLLPEWTSLLGRSPDGTLLALARTSFDVAELCRFSGSDTLAFELYSHALATRRHVLGPDHPDVLAARLGIAQVWLGQGRWAAAREECEAVRSAGAPVLGADHEVVEKAAKLLGLLGDVGPNP
ncbi:tetratricopeptide repeat protein [Saccharothrix sp. HUAS TT1]|uniref:tetratricopeptide repeat protein n=1 Tax=unclassified Saccharothrix TaxID=2593673 RepID=UPI00345B5E97